jgi:MFS family permease
MGHVVTATVLGLMGTDLVLPAIPSLPQSLGGDPASAQLVLAAYVGGTSAGLLAFGALGDRFATRRLFNATLLLNALASLA